MSGEQSAPIVVVIRDEPDLAIARNTARELGGRAGFEWSALEALATAVSEIARNILEHARAGEIELAPLERDGLRGVQAIARDSGPGIADPRRAMEDGYSTSGGLGFGLPGARRLVDEFELVSEVGRGTKVTMRKWAR